MSESKQNSALMGLAVVIVIVSVSFTIGFFLGVNRGEKKAMLSGIDVGVAEYNNLTGELQWKKR